MNILRIIFETSVLISNATAADGQFLFQVTQNSEGNINSSLLYTLILKRV
jgi:hypothetical protein